MASRFAPEIPFPPYSFVPGLYPHPNNDPEGHSYALAREEKITFHPEEWRDSRLYLYGIDLFNHGYYWEAHETWEELWIACGRHGITADFVKGLIKLAAAGVKVREGVPEGVRKLAQGARLLFHKTAQRLGSEDARYLGLSVKELVQFSYEIAEWPTQDDSFIAQSIAVVFSFFLKPEL